MSQINMNTPNPVVPSPLCSTLKEMSQPNVERLIEILQANWKEGIKPEPEEIKRYLSSLYPPPNDQSEEAINFTKFLDKHEISFLGGSGKSTQSFLVKNKDTDHSEVFGVKRNNILTEKMKQELEVAGLIPYTPVQKQSQKQEGFSLFITKYFPSGSLEKRYENKPLTPTERYKQCSEDIQKMITGFQRLQQYNILFSDAKVTNWLLGNDGNLIIADTKSLLSIDQIRASTTPLFLTKSDGYIPPEIENSIQPDQINSNNIHAFILGANLYDYLTGKPLPEQINSNAFSDPLFEGIIGEQYKNLILNLTQTEPSSRMSLDNGMKELKFIDLLIKVSTKPGVNIEEIINNKDKILERFSTETHYNYGRQGVKGRSHTIGNEINLNNFRDLKEQYQDLKGDHLKQRILQEFKLKIEQVSDPKELAALKVDLKNTSQYKVLAKSQGWFTKDGETSSIKAFEKMFKDQEDNINKCPITFTGSGS